MTEREAKRRIGTDRPRSANPRRTSGRSCAMSDLMPVAFPADAKDNTSSSTAILLPPNARVQRRRAGPAAQSRWLSAHDVGWARALYRSPPLQRDVMPLLRSAATQDSSDCFSARHEARVAGSAGLLPRCMTRSCDHRRSGATSPSLPGITWREASTRTARPAAAGNFAARRGGPRHDHSSLHLMDPDNGEIGTHLSAAAQLA